MIYVKLFGLLRLDTGIKEITIEKAECIKDIYPFLYKKAKEININSNITIKDIEGCIAIVNGKQVNKSFKLKDNDVVHLMSPVCGG